ncbi:hypothetical protein FHT67_005383 [Paenibacillus sp. BK720]|nr:hypothetical protein [Paenibacillus sp. BK720]
MTNAQGLSLFNVPKRILSLLLSVLILMSAFIFAQQANAASSQIVNNTTKYDTDGNPIWAQGGWVVKEGNTFYWYGMDFSTSGVKKINVYTSTDLVNWTSHQGIVDFSSINAKLDAIGDTTTVRFASTQWVGRPFVMYNSVINKYVMFAEWGSGDGNRNKITIFTSDSAAGPFTYEKYISQPGGWKMGDLGSIFTDSDGSTYITYTIDYNNITNAGLQISKLSSDFMSIDSVTKTFASTGPYKEATTLFKTGSKYIMMASTTNGWKSSQTWCYSSTSMSGTWTTPYVCATSPSSTNSFDTQIDQVLPIQGTQGTVYMYIGDRWNNFSGGSTGVGRNQWYPLTFDSNGNPVINGYSQWYIDPAAGTWSSAAPAGQVDTSLTYALVNGNSGKALGVTSNETTDGATLEQRSYTGAVSQSWKFVDAGSGYYKILNVNSGKYIDISGASTADGAQGVQLPASSSTSQQWQLIDAGSGNYSVINRSSGKYLCISAGATTDGAPVIQWTQSGSANQTWRFDTVAPIDLTKTYSITNRNSGKTLGTVGDATADGTSIEQRTYSGAPSQSWQFEYTNGFYKFKNVNSGKYMDINGASTADGAVNIINTSSGSISQLWQLVDAGGGYYKLKNVNSGKMLGISAGSTADGGINLQWSDSGSMNQNWSFAVLNP